MKDKIKKKIQLQGKEVEYFLCKSLRARRVRLSVGVGGVVSITTPWYCSEQKVVGILLDKASWILQKVEYFKRVGQISKLGGSRKDFLQNKEKARELVDRLIKEINREEKFVFKRVAIKNNKTRWGSCSKKGNLNFNYQIVALPPNLARYLVVHELCHLKEMNHSRRFWSLVGEYVPDYKILSKQLRKNIF